MSAILEWVNSLVWGAPALIAILAVGLWLTLRTGFVQLRLLPEALRRFFHQLRGGEGADGTVSPFQAVCTALAATVGTGNLAGVAGAMAIGGPGAIFWMWVCAFLGMATKFAEASLAVRYRHRDDGGEYVGGPMYMIRKGMGKGWHWLAWIYSFFGIIAAFGVGNATQVNTVISGVNEALSAFGFRQTLEADLLMGIGLAVLIVSMLLGGMKRIGAVAERLVPFAAAAYLLLGAAVLLMKADQLPEAFQSIFLGAVSPRAVTGGMVGSAFSALRIGVSRGVFTNEAGMGTASIAHAAAQVEHPAQQGMMGIVEVFLDTVVICTVTALVILVSGVPIPYGHDTGMALTSQAFSYVLGSWVNVFLAAALCCFAIATVLGWGLYGIRCAQYLLGHKAWRPFVLLQAGAVIAGAVLNTGTVWLLSEIVNGLMAVPNLIALAALSGEAAQIAKDYKRTGGTYEDIHQCQPLRAFAHAKVPSSGGEGRTARQKDPPSEYRPA